MELFQYAVIYVPNADDELGSPEVVVPITEIVSSNAQNATLRAARDIPEEWIEKLDNLQVVVRPF